MSSADPASAEPSAEAHRAAFRPLGTLFGFFLVSGFCGLVYEIVWLRLAMAAFGVTTPMVSLVLSVFMAGLGIGSWAGGRLERWMAGGPRGRPLRIYAACEALIATSGPLVPFLLLRGREALLTRSGVGWASAGHYAAAGGWLALTLLPFCIAMGATFPIGLTALRAFRGSDARGFSLLYLANVIGATAGTLAAAFVLIEAQGFRGAATTAALLNFALAACAAWLARRADREPEPVRGADPSLAAPAAPDAFTSAAASDSASAAGTLSVPAVWIASLIFLSGFTGMALEVIWARAFTPFIGTFVYSFALILALYLAATAAGAAAARRGLIAALPRGAALPALGACLLALAGMTALVPADPRLPMPQVAFEGALRVALGVVPFSALAGFLTPSLVDLWAGGRPSRAARAYALNVAGCILGPLAASFLLLPAMGEGGATAVLCAGLLAAAVAAVVTTPRAPRLDGSATGSGRTWAWIAGTLLLGTTIGALARGFDASLPGARVERDATATVIAAGAGRNRHLFVNGIGITSMTPITKFMAHVPLAMLDRRPDGVLVICLGMGTTFRSALTWDTPVTAVELVPSVPKLLDFFNPDAPRFLASPNAHIVVDDGRRFLERTSGFYDVVTVDPPPPLEAAGSSLLYSTEFSRAVRSRLRPGGIFQQWVGGGDESLDIIVGVARSLATAFPEVRAYRSVEGWGVHFLASDRPLGRLGADELAARLPDAARADFVEWGPENTPEAQIARFLSGEAPMSAVLELAPGIPAIEDDRPINEYFFLRRRFPAETPRTAPQSAPRSVH